MRDAMITAPQSRGMPTIPSVPLKVLVLRTHSCGHVSRRIAERLGNAPVGLDFHRGLAAIGLFTDRHGQGQLAQQGRTTDHPPPAARHRH